MLSQNFVWDFLPQRKGPKLKLLTKTKNRFFEQKLVKYGISSFFYFQIFPETSKDF